jgi:cytochrome c peroxidase
VVEPGVAFVEFGSLQQDSSRWSASLIQIGKRLFEDPELSRSGRISCRNCHNPAHGWADGRALSAAADGPVGRRNSPTLIGATQRRSWRWDGQHGSLSAAVLAPLTDPAELANPNRGAVLARIAADARYSTVFGGLPTERDLAGALAAFIGSIAGRTRFDQFVEGESEALSDEEILGLHLFRTKARCANCHFGPLLTDEGFHNLRLSSFGEASEDLGRQGVTGLPDDTGRFRTPSLRAVARTAPYMHNGLFGTLEGVVGLYARGGGEIRARHQTDADRPLFPEAARLDPLIRPLDLTPAERAALAAFLRTL